MTAGSHVSIPKPFSSGDVVQWFQRFDLCSDANKWEDEVKAIKMPTLLEGEALAAWLDLAEETKKDYETAKKQLIDGLMPIAFTLLDKFHARKLLPGESHTVFSHDLRKLIVRAMPEIDSKARDQLLLHQFIAGLPLRVSRELRAAGETKELGVTLQRARLLLSLEDQHQLTESGPLGSSTKQPNEREQAMAASIDRLTQQVAALSEQVETSRRRGGNNSRQAGRVESNTAIICFNCGRRGHIARYCRQENSNGAPARGSTHPDIQ